MAALAIRKCEPFPKVSIELRTFEDWEAGTARFDLLFSAQAWHWIRPEVRWVKAAGVLRPGATLAVFGHRTDWHEEVVRDDLEDLYRRLAPDLLAQDPGFPGLHRPAAGDPMLSELVHTGLFTGAEARIYPWTVTLRAGAFVDLLSTQSHHRLLDGVTRAALFDAVRALIADHGDEVTVPHATSLVLATSHA